MSVSLPPCPVEFADPPLSDQQALIEEARRRARRRRRRNLVGMIAALLGFLWLYSLLGRGEPPGGSTLLSGSPSEVSALHRAALPEEISFNADGGVWMIHRDGTRHRLVDHTYAAKPDGSLRTVSTIHGVEWSPDGSKLLAFRQSASPALVLVDRSGHISRTIATGASIGHWSPDGSHIAFMRDTPGAGDAIWVASSEGANPTRVAGFGRRDLASFSWSPNGRQIVYAGRGGNGLFIADATGRHAPRSIRIAAGDDLLPGTEVGQAQWSPDGSLIAFRSRGGVYVMRPDKTRSRRVASGILYGRAWSPDSRWLAFAATGGPQTFGNVAVVARDGSDIHRVARCSCKLRGPGFMLSIDWSSDGSRLAYVGGHGNVVSTVRVGGEDATIVLTGTARVASPWTPLWRPDHLG